MPQTFSFEEASAPRTFSFEEALGTDAGPSTVEKVADAAESAVVPTLKVLKAVGQGYPVAEAGANLASGMISMVPAGIAGLVAGGDADVVRKVSEALTYQPKSEGGKLLTGGVQYGLDKASEAADVAGEFVREHFPKGGALATPGGLIPISPEVAATIVNTGVQLAPAALGFRRGTKFSYEEATKPELPPEAPKAAEARVEPTMKGEAPVVAETPGKVEPTVAAAVVPSDNPVLNAKVEASHKAILAEQATKQETVAPMDFMEELRRTQQQQAANTSKLLVDVPKNPDGTPRFADLSYEQLDELHQRAIEHNNVVELSVIKQYLGDDALKEYEAKKTMRGRDNWWLDHITEDAQNAANKRMVDEETIKEHRDAVNNFDTESPMELGRSLVMRVKEMDKPGFQNSPDFTTMQNALRFAKEQGWNLDEVTAGMRRRAVDLYGNDAPELLSRLFRPPSEAKSASAVEQPQLPPPNTTVNLMIGVSPAEAIKGIKESYSPFVGVPVELRKRAPLGDSLLKVFAPAARGEEAALTANIVRANLGKQALERERALTELKDTAAIFDRMAPEENYKFIDAMESGTKIDNPTLNKAAADLRKLLDSKRDEVQALGAGRLEDFIDNYFPHIWADKAKAASFFSRRPLEGSKSFLKERTYDTFKEGMDAGLKPLTDNPVELALLKAREMDRYIAGQKIFGEMKDAGLAKFVKFGDKPPEGYAKINDKIARVMSFSEPEGGMVLRGEYYAPETAAHVINNHVSPGLQGNGVYDAFRQSGNMINSLQLGLSAFHLGFTTFDAMISKIALGIKQASRGDVLPGIANIAQGFNPAQPIMNLIKGDRLLKAYTGELKDPGLAPIVEALTDAGGRIRMDDFYRNTTINGFKQALRTGRYGAAGMKLLPTIMDRMNKPIFEYLVPRQKLGVFFDMAKDALDQNPSMDLATKRQVLGKLWDSVDNRMGELVYDNLFWDRTLKDSLMASVRSVGWNLGTFRELGGGAADIRKILANKGLTDRTAYIIALPFMTSVIGSVLTYLYTGEQPRDLKDRFFPRTGKIRPDGSEDRLSLPSYMKDVYEYYHDLAGFGKYGSDPTRTLQNKMHPLISTIGQMISNKDFFGANIRNPTSPLVAQLIDEGRYLFKQIQPFSVRNYLQQAQVKKETPTVQGYLTSPSMIGIVPAPGYVTKNEAQNESAAISASRDAMIKRFRQDLKEGVSRDKIIAQMQKAGLGPRDIMFVLRSSQEDKPPARLKKYGE